MLDAWIKDILPVMPDQSLQEVLLHLLQEQDDLLVEGLLCLLDTHMALYVSGKKEPEKVCDDIRVEPEIFYCLTLYYCCRACWTRIPPAASSLS